MLGIHGFCDVLYIVGIIMMIVNIIQSIFAKKGHFFNPSEIEMTKDDKTVAKMRLIYRISQGVMLVLFVFCFIRFKDYIVALVCFTVGNILPVGLVQRGHPLDSPLAGVF